MKRIIAVIVTLIFMSTSVYAEGLDLSSMSLDELVAMRDLYEEEIRNRTALPSSELYNGEYMVGTDIKPGRYLITVIKHSSGGLMDSAMFTTLTADDKYDQFGLDDGESQIIVLDEGTSFKVYSVITANMTSVPIADYAP